MVRVLRQCTFSLTRCARCTGVACRRITSLLAAWQFATLVADVVPRSTVERVVPHDLIRSAYLSAYDADDSEATQYFDEGETAGDTLARDELRDSMMET